MYFTLRYFFLFGFMSVLPTLLIGQEKHRTYTDYVKEREMLMQQDSQTYFDAGLVLTDKEQALNKRLVTLQQQMLKTYKDEHFFPPARNFYQSKKHIEETALFGLIKEMPKGGILHLHTGAIGDADWIIQKAWQTPEMHVYWSDNEDTYIKGAFQAFKKGTAPEGFVQVRQLINDQQDAYQDMRSLLVFDDAIDRDSVDIWGEFEKIFGRINQFINYKPIYEDYVVHGLSLLAADNIQHAELRGPFLDLFYDLDHEQGTMGIESLVTAFENIKTRIRHIDPSFTFTIIHCSLRFRGKERIWNEMHKVYQHRQVYPDLVKGFDLVAEEDAGHSTLFHAKEFLRLDSLDNDGIPLPLYLHDGESNWASSANLYDAVLLGTKRIGHGFNLFRFPQLLELVKQQNICMEINPLSNQILGYIRDLRNHPASTYLRRGINCTINSDDPLIFDYHGLSYDFWTVFLAWELDLAGLKQLSKNSMLYSTLTDKEKAEALRVWEKRWELFVIKMLTAEFPSD